jgi:hypothetical protein
MNFKGFALMVNNRIVRWWIALEPAVQYITWIAVFCLVVVSGVSIIVLSSNMGIGILYMRQILIGIGVVVSFFVFIVLWLTIRWPKIRGQYKKLSDSDIK